MPQPVQRTCPVCGHAETTIFERCSACGASFFERPPRSRRALWALGAVLALGLAGATGAVLDVKAERDARERALTAAAVEREKARLRRVQAPRRGAARELRPPAGALAAERLAARAALVEAAERSITADARARVRAGELRGTIVRTDCGPIEKRPDAVPDDRDLSLRTGRYDCIAVERPVVDGDGRRVADYGSAFVAALDFERFTYVWCRNNPPQSERGVSVHVRLERECLAATGRALGTGYVDDR